MISVKNWRSALRRGEARGRVFLRSGWAVGEMLLSGRPRHSSDAGWLILPRLDGIGDFWLWLPLVATFKKAFPDLKIHLLANSLWADLARFTGLFDKITSLVPQKLLRSPTYRRQTWTLLKKEPPGLLLNTTLRRRIAVEDSLAWFYPASERWALRRSPDALEPPYLARAIDTLLYDKAWPTSSSPLHPWKVYEEFVPHLGGAGLDYGTHAALHASWPKLPMELPKPYLIFLPGAAAPYRKPQPTLIRHLLEQAWETLRLPLVLLGTPYESSYAQATTTSLPSRAISDLIGRTSLVETVSAIMHAEAVIGPETGLTHIAATWGKPTLVLMGGGHWGRFFPYPASFPYQPFILHRPMSCYGCGWFCQYTLSQKAPYPCIATLEQAPMEPFYRWLQAVSARK